MAKKDTITALTKRGIDEETATLLVTRFGTMGAIAEQGSDGLKEAGLTDEKADLVIGAIGKRSRTTRKTKSSESSESTEAVSVKLEPVEFTRSRPKTEMEAKLVAIAERLGIKVPNAHVGESGRDAVESEPGPGDKVLPLKVVVDLAAKIEKADISDDKCTALVERAAELYADHQMDRNESAGIMAAHSIGEPGTQMNLRTFHFAGDSFVSVTRGLPRLIEIVDAREKPSTPTMEVPLVGLAREDEGIAKRIASKIETTTLSSVAAIEVDTSTLSVVIRPDKLSLEEKGLTMDDLEDRLSKIKAVRGLIRRSGDEFTVTVDNEDTPYTVLQQVYDSVREAKVGGIEGIKQAFVKRDEDKNGNTFYTIITDGSNLKEILKEEMVDKSHVKTNSICEVADVLGIEAARNAIVEEAYGTLADASLNVDIRHIMMVADVMTNDGTVRAIGRHGISGKKSSVLARAAFEITAAHLLHAAITGEVDHLEGVTENIIVGQPVTLGTGAVNLKYAPNKKGENE